MYDAAPSFAPHLSPVEARRHIKPTAIAGDLDSISKEVRQFYGNEGTRIIDLSHDQDSTDFQKCLCELEKQFDAEQLLQYTIIAAGQCHCSCIPLQCHDAGFARMPLPYLVSPTVCIRLHTGVALTIPHLSHSPAGSAYTKLPN